MGANAPHDVPAGFWVREASHFPQPPSPLMRSLFPILTGGLGRMCFEMGVLAETIEWRVIGGWTYARVVPPGGKDRKAPPRWLTPLVVRATPAVRRSTRRAVEAARTDRFAAHLERWHTEWRPALVADIAELRGVDPSALDSAGLGRHLQQVHDLTRRAWTTHMLIHGVDAYFLADLAFTCRALFGWSDAQTLELLTGLSHASTTPARRLAELAALARKQIPTGTRLDRREETVGFVDRLRETSEEFRVAFAAYQHEFGFRAIRYEAAEPTMAETPAFTVGLIADQLRSDFDPLTSAQAAAHQRDAAGAEARRRLTVRPSAETDRFERALRRAEWFYPVREDYAPMTFSEPLALIRRVAREAGSRLADRSALEGADDVFFLEYAEITGAIRALTDDSGGGDHRPLVTRRAEEQAWALAHPGPPSYGADPGPPPFLAALPPAARFANKALSWWADRLFALSESARQQPAGRTLTGIGASGGTYTGPVRVLLGEGDFAKLEPGDVLVCPVTSPAWSVLYPQLGGLVTEAGGLLSHPAIIAREFRIPAVVGTGNATRILRDGQTVMVDGTAGIVEVIP